ncbi:ferrochelatase [Pyxidicoccus fallax]|uniref:Ferrochelatase n=1 Tax=Pyxidicoccus fallax TaxID=394095 RepID=A0A848LV90_9BACT|nr:ferrochelatase [Pyxidicoccus fallax]NMO21373.1 ferrochelatase [Pyxidicoccus fallax]NPC82437.1 ferrochelatase [Pyxidicoccus fallax]
MTRLPNELAESLDRVEPLLGARASLAPDRPLAPTPRELAERVTAGSHDEARLRAFTRGLCAIIRALAESFPDNIFWDLDYPARCLWDSGGPREMEVFTRRVVALCHGFGLGSPLRFRYAHDFFFGFDWARWVTREPTSRASIHPFDAPFLDYLEVRRGELLALVAQDDAKYSRLQGAEFRNPFGFSREPEEELRLHQALAREDLIPVKAWRMDGEPRWNLPFADLRTETARRLGLSRGTPS